MPDYELKSLNLPKLTGNGLIAFTALMENPLSRQLLSGSLLENGGIPKLRRTNLEESPTFYPLAAPASENPFPIEPFEADEKPKKLPFATARDYRRYYQDGSLSPLDVAQRVLEAVEASEKAQPPLRAFIAIDHQEVLRQAQASAERWKKGAPLSLLDGVPIAVKDEIDMLPYPTTVGTRFLGTKPALKDSTVAARLRQAGAVLIGKTNMHEIGINPNGFNAHYGTARNPYNTECDCGGSSSGSAVAVAAGLVPIAIGADGGGSIRIPAALCGLVGLKATFGRVSEFGAAPLCWSVAHIGPLTTNVEDLALTYSIIAGSDELDEHSLLQPPLTFWQWNKPDLSKLRIGIYKDWFEHADPEIVEAAYAAVEQFKQAGAEVREVVIPFLDEMRIAHAITILSEMATCMNPYRAQRNLHGAAVRLSLVLGDLFEAKDYLQAQRARTKAMRIFSEVYKEVDVILTPATAKTAQPYPQGGLSHGWSDLSLETEMMRFIISGNLCGFPAISFPIGYDRRGLPIGMQAMSRHWEEHVLLRVAYIAEQFVNRQKPPRFYQIL